MDKQTYIYKTIDNHNILLDVYKADCVIAPAIIYLHGGALIWGSRNSINPEQIAFYHDLGFTVIAMDYRLAPYTKLLDIIDDVKDGIDYCINNHNSLNIDKERIVVVGSSAGGYLSLLSGTFLNKPKAIISLYGYGDIVSDWYCRPSSHYLLSPLVSKEEAYKVIEDKIISEGKRNRFTYYLYTRQTGTWTDEVSGGMDKKLLINACPRLTAGNNFPETLLIHGDLDTDVPYYQSVLMSEKLSSVKVPHKLLIVEGKNHAFDYDMKDETVKKVFKEIYYFLERIR